MWIGYTKGSWRLVRRFRKMETAVGLETGMKTKMIPQEVFDIANQTIVYKASTREPSLGEDCGLFIYISCLPFRAHSTGPRLPLTDYLSLSIHTSETHCTKNHQAPPLHPSQTQPYKLASRRDALGPRSTPRFVRNPSPNLAPTNRRDKRSKSSSCTKNGIRIGMTFLSLNLPQSCPLAFSRHSAIKKRSRKLQQRVTIGSQNSEVQ